MTWPVSEDEGARRMTLVVSSCDLFFDSWVPFFSLLRKFWRDCPYPIVLITNQLDVDEGPVKATVLGKDQGWSSNLIAALKRIETPYVFYIQEDQFLTGTVDEPMIRRMMALMQARELEFVSFRATPAHTGAEVEPELPVHYPPVDQGKGVFCDPAVWRRESFLRVLKPGETAWDFLKAGRKRVGALRYRRAQCDKARLAECPVHYIKRSGIRFQLWHPKAMLWLRRNRVRLWPLHRGILLQSTHLYLASKKDKLNRALRRKYTGFGILSRITKWQQQLTRRHLQREIARRRGTPVPLHQELEKYDLRRLRR